MPDLNQYGETEEQIIARLQRELSPPPRRPRRPDEQWARVLWDDGHHERFRTVRQLGAVLRTMEGPRDMGRWCRIRDLHAQMCTDS